MATYTTELRTLIEQPTQHMDDLTLDQKIEVGRVMLFDFDYPMFDERYKRVFETNFIRHFYYREIGFETEELFKQRLQNWLNLNMGYFSKLFDSEMLKFDPFINSKVDVTHTRKNDRDSLSDTLFGETTSRDLGETITTDEDTTHDTDKGVVGDTTYDTDFGSDKNTDTIGNTTYDTDFTGDKNTDTIGNTTDDTDFTGNKNTDTIGDTTDDTIFSGDKTKDTDRDVNTTGETDGTSSGKSDTTESTTQGTTETIDKNTESFSRQLHSDTPDGRLRLTLNEGEGTAEYVSDITENKETGKEGVVTDTQTQTDSDTHTTSSDTTHSETTENEKTLENVTENEGYNKNETGTSSENKTENETYNKGEKGTSSENKTENEITTKGEIGSSSENKTEHETNTKGEIGTSSEDTDISEVGTRDEVVERVLRELGERNYDQNVTGNIKDLEDYVEHRVGKIGIQTYSKMLQEFRGTFMRIEVDIFREMEGRLFMLVY